jgi:prevent-host-death family protein
VPVLGQAFSDAGRYVHEAKQRLNDLGAAAERGEDVVIARNGAPVARLVAVRREREPASGRSPEKSSSLQTSTKPLPAFVEYTA